ncbi:hypothetical protein [Lentibacillus amyloliquefaciens]|nr:hypothetical protein [Lentibacillus amyloliquefaciens]
MNEKRYMALKALEKFLWFLQSKSESVYAKETEAVKQFLDKTREES